MAEKEETKKATLKRKVRSKKVESKLVVKPVPVKRVRNPRNDLAEREAVVNFKAWFVNQISKDKRIKEHHYEQVRLYMKGLGLKDLEPTWKFEMGLRQYYGG